MELEDDGGTDEQCEQRQHAPGQRRHGADEAGADATDDVRSDDPPLQLSEALIFSEALISAFFGFQ